MFGMQHDGVSGAAPQPPVRLGYEAARLRLAKIHDEGRETRGNASRIACEHSARTLEVDRVSIWFLSDDEECIHCSVLFELESNRFSEGLVIPRRESPTYFDAIRASRVMIVEDVHTDTRTAGLGDYLSKHHISALLDAAIYRDGQVVGVVCHEQVGAPRAWTEADAGFACAVADMLTILFAQAERAELRAEVEAQRELNAQHNKMRALTQLGRVVVHDLGNLLTVALLRAEALSHDPGSEASGEIAEVLRYSTRLLRQLQDFSNERAPGGIVDVGKAIRGLGSTLTALFGKDIDFKMLCAVEGVTLALAQVELEQLVLNLCTNAFEAMSGPGRAEVIATRDSGYVMLVVSDSGRGMDEATLERLYEPFFSTKAEHTGIGLAAVYGTVARVGGTIHVSSLVGHGTTFHVRLPIASAPHTSA
jgi:two-component system, cell cycle sensor histidine kinase and response regulator CckA